MFLLDHSSSAIVSLRGRLILYYKATAVFQNCLILKQSKHSQVNILTANGSSVMANDTNENHRGIVIYKSLIGAMPTDKLWLETLW